MHAKNLSADTWFESIINTEVYPIHNLHDSNIRELVVRCQQELNEVGCFLIPNFIREQSLTRMLEESQRLMPRTYWSQSSHTPYMTADDPNLPEDHPRRFFQQRSSGFINSDELDADSDLNRFYESATILAFVSACLGVSPIYQWADPLARNPYSIMHDGQYFPWHFDGNEFTVSLLVQQPEEGGIFEYAPDIRDPENENYDRVNAVLRGSSNEVHRLNLRPGDMQLFKGRFSLHRVTKVKGSKPRIIALPTYVLDPETVNRPERAKQFYGRALPVHYERENTHRPDRLTD